MKKKLNSRIFFLAMILLVFFVWHNNAFALTVSPVRIEVSGDPGTTLVKQISLLNDTKAQQTYYISYANFEAQGETGSPFFVEPKNDLGTWMDAGQSVTLGVDESKAIPIIIKIPKDAYAGGHFAAVFFGSNPGNSGQVSIGSKTGVLVLLSVNGNILEAGGLTSFNTLNNQFFYNSLPVDLEYRWQNNGNDRVMPKEKLLCVICFIYQ